MAYNGNDIKTTKFMKFGEKCTLLLMIKIIFYSINHKVYLTT